MMVKFRYMILLVCIAGCFAACSKKSVDVYDPEPQFRADTTAIRAFIKANNIPALKDQYGIFYQIIEPGNGNVVYNSATQISADYEGRLLDGTIFDSSKGTPITFALGRVIGGWQLGIPKIQKGGKIRLIIPSFYGYGNVAQGNILPANSILDFNITLTDVTN
ncbi:FKBP-type peptidyl-prolyl cis-trans isomerase [Pedobacter chinensis]|nr:FKBP-type peptidyl-prolyl cis-trans isomerase [Pedobacter chinensis]